MKLLVFQHIECEHPGIFRGLLDGAGIQWDAVELDVGEKIPAFESYDALWVMGGPMDVWDEDECPWLVPEKAAIRHWVCDLKKPYLGFCLGHQLLADALGGVCSWLYHRSGQLLASITLHATFNTSTFLLITIFQEKI